MKLAAFQAWCPFEIGDTVPYQGDKRRITDIACIHHVKDNTVEFMYELDGSGELVRLSDRKEAQKSEEQRDPVYPLLRPCKICGTPAQIVYYVRQMDTVGRYYAGCPRCGARTQGITLYDRTAAECKEEAARLWNDMMK